MDRRELEIMLNEAFDRGIVSVGHSVHETVEVGFLNELGRTVGFTLNGWKEAIETIPVDLFDSFDDSRGRERFLSDCKALGGKVPQNTYRGELARRPRRPAEALRHFRIPAGARRPGNRADMGDAEAEELMRDRRRFSRIDRRHICPDAYPHIGIHTPRHIRAHAYIHTSTIAHMRARIKT